MREFFAELPCDLGLAYIVIIHLSLDHPSALAQVLKAVTGMEVSQVDEAVKFQPNCIRAPSKLTSAKPG